MSYSDIQLSMLRLSNKMDCVVCLADTECSEQVPSLRLSIHQNNMMRSLETLL